MPRSPWNPVIWPSGVSSDAAPDLPPIPLSINKFLTPARFTGLRSGEEETILMILRSCTPADLPVLLELFSEAVHTTCADDYSPAQLDAWAPAEPDCASWAEKLSRETFLAAEEDGSLLGFASLDGDYLDLLYVRPDRQRQGIADILCGFLERMCTGTHIQVHASKTARPFFEARGYRVLQQHQAERRGQTLTNFLMEKELNVWT